MTRSPTNPSLLFQPRAIKGAQNTTHITTKPAGDGQHCARKERSACENKTRPEEPVERKMNCSTVGQYSEKIWMQKQLYSQFALATVTGRWITTSLNFGYFFSLVIFSYEPRIKLQRTFYTSVLQKWPQMKSARHGMLGLTLCDSDMPFA